MSSSSNAAPVPAKGSYCDFAVESGSADGDMILDRIIQASKLRKNSDSCESFDARNTSTRSARSSVSSMDAPTGPVYRNGETYNAWRMRWL